MSFIHKYIPFSHKINLVVEWLIFLLRIRVVPGKIFTRIPAILTEIFCGFLQSPGKWLNITLKLGHDLFLPRPFPSLIIHFIPRYVV
jgi:hypothetical protein